MVVTDGFRSATFHSAQHSGSTDPYVGESFRVILKDVGLTAEQGVFVFSHDWAALAAFFNNLAESWRGWTGTKSWESVEHDLTIEARSDAGRHCLLSFIVRDGAGEDMTSLAASFNTWTGQERSI